MKTLILMRHAKSSWSEPQMDDSERPLNKRGRRNASEIGRWLADTGHLPQYAFVSPSTRTRETWQGIAGELQAPRADFLPALYHASAETMLQALKGAPDTAASLLMLGHQPGIGDFALRLLPAQIHDPEFARYPTAATAVIAFDADSWSAVGWGNGRLIDFVTPHTLLRGMSATGA
jgi:phosphohistidine phosphatase